MIEITGLTKRYGSHTVLDNIDFTVEAGTIAAVVGGACSRYAAIARATPWNDGTLNPAGRRVADWPTARDHTVS